MAKHTTYILSEDARSQAEFYTNALGGEVLSIMTYGQLPDSNDAIKDKVVHLSLVAGGVNLFMSDAFEPIQCGNNINLSLEFATEDEAREAFAKLAEGGKVKYPLEPAFWGALHGQLEDKFGVLWMISNEAKQN
ncbi:VOC family protein [Paenibacillus humicus]|uniref:VOC family protein n=1 Tax=Paenibacillus humicus TaxID=412861 RepID=UPI003D269898